MEALTACKIVLIVGGFLLVPVLGGILGRYQKQPSNIGFISIFLGSLVSLAGFGLCVWNCIYASCGICSALVVFLIAWLAFLFLSFSLYTTQLKN